MLEGPRNEGPLMLYELLAMLGFGLAIAAVAMVIVLA